METRHIPGALTIQITTHDDGTVTKQALYPYDKREIEVEDEK